MTHYFHIEVNQGVSAILCGYKSEKVIDFFKSLTICLACVR